MFIHLRTLGLALVGAVLVTPSAYAGDAAAAKPSDAITPAMYFHSQIKDAADCKLTAVDGKLVFDAAVTSPAAQCPDAFAWKRFLETIKAGFWTNWAYDQFTWPAEPLAMCSTTVTKTCCDPAAATNPGYGDADNPAKNCPYFPGDHGGRKTLLGAEQVKAHITAFNGGAGSLTSEPDPGRVMRQEMAEVVFRNKPMWQWVFDNNAYSTDGLADLFAETKRAATTKAPYRVPGLQVSFPAGSIMFKTDWLHVDDAKALGIVQNDQYPYITMMMKSAVGDNDAERFTPGLHLLVAITAASKDLPNWHWYAVEHVLNPGRCDYTGCNDSFGYTNQGDLPAGVADNYVAPHMKSDGLVSPAMVFKVGQTYQAETITPELDALFKALSIGQGKSASADMPSASDKAWLSYRLKGTQTEMTSMDGMDTILGNTVTEGGFVQTSSCLTCHAQATVDAEGRPGISSIGFSRELSMVGYAESTRGPTDPDWFYEPASNVPTAVPFDFTWGILFANPIKK